MRILHIESSMELGGQEFRVLNEARGMQERGHTVILAADPRSQIAARAKLEGVTVEPILMKQFRSVRVIRHLLQTIEKYGIEVINSHGSLDGWTGAIAGRLSREHPLVIRTRHKSTPVRKNLRHWIYYKKLSHAIITTGNEIKQTLIHQFNLEENRVCSIPTGVDLKRFQPLQPDEKLKHELGVESGNHIVGTVAFLRGYKGLNYFLEAARKISNTMPNVRFLIIGSGGEADNLTLKIQELGLTKKVILTGFREDIPQILALMNVFVLPSTEAEGIPQAITQALAMERAVVATSVGGIPEVIQDGKTGFLVERKDHLELANKICTLLDNSHLQQSFGLAGRKVVLERFGHETMLDRTEEFCTKWLTRIKPASVQQGFPPSIQDQIDVQTNLFVTKNKASWPIRRLEELPLEKMNIVQERNTWFQGQNHRRIIYYHEKERAYYKIWDVDYIRKENFLNGLNSGFFDKTLIPALNGIILDSHHHVRGYIMQAGTPLRKVTISMFVSLLQRTIQTGFFYYELHHKSVIVLEGKTSFIDLESIYPLSRLPELHKENAFVRPKPYHKLLEQLSEEISQARERGIDITSLATVEHWESYINEMDIILK